MKSLNFQPQLQTLEDRLNPAQISWVGEYSSDTTDPNNWWDEYLQPALPGPSDDVYFIPHELPTNDPYSDESGVFVSYPADNFHGSFHSVTLALGYESVVTLDGSLYLQDFHMNDGTIRQPSSSYEINAFSWFTWTNGTINDTATLGELYVASGATVEIEPRDGGTVATGTTLNIGGFGIQAAVEGVVRTGTIEFSNGSDLNLNEYASMSVEAADNMEVSFVNADPANESIQKVSANANLHIRGRVTNDGIPLWVSGGSVNVRDNSTLEVSGKLNGAQQPQVSILVTAGSINLWHVEQSAQNELSAIILGKDGIVLDGPTANLDTHVLPNSVGPLRSVLVGGNLTMKDGSITHLSNLTDRSPDHQQAPLISRINIIGDFKWEGGTYKPYVAWDQTDYCDSLYVVGQITITCGQGNAKLQPGVFNSLGVMDSPANSPQVGRQWKVIYSSKPIIYIGNPLAIVGNWKLASTAADAFVQIEGINPPPQPPN